MQAGGWLGEQVGWAGAVAGQAATKGAGGRQQGGKNLFGWEPTKAAQAGLTVGTVVRHI